MNHSDEIRKELSRATTFGGSDSSCCSGGFLTMRTANEWIDIAKARPDPLTFFHKMIVSNENTVIFAASNAGKSVLAVQIAEEIAMTHPVVYVDLEMSDKQFQMRYTDGETVHRFPDNFVRAEINAELLLDHDLEQGIIDSIEEAAAKGVKVFIIDNITFACMSAERSEVAGEFMKRIIFLKNKYQLTIIAIAHTPKRYSNAPLTQYDLAGSARLINLFDAGIAMGLSVKGKCTRYIKQVKTRTGSLLYGEDNVAVCELCKEDGWLHFKFTGYENERNHLVMSRNEMSKSDLQEKVKGLVKIGMSIRQIEHELDISHGTAQRMVSEARQEIQDAEGETGVPDVSDVPTVSCDTPDTLGTLGTIDTEGLENE